MASVFFWGEDNGAATATPARGTTRTTGRSEINFKNIDDSTTNYATVPIAAGSNSFTKYQFGIWTGSFTQLSNGKFNHTSGVLGSTFTLKGLIHSGYATPSASTNASLWFNYTSTGLISTGSGILFSTFGPESGNSGTLANPGYSNYCQLQLQTTAASPPGDLTGTLFFAISWDET